MLARLPACRSYLLNEAERPDNRLAARRSQSMVRRGNWPRKTYEPASGNEKRSSWGGTEGGTIKITWLLITDRFQHRRPAARFWSEYYYSTMRFSRVLRLLSSMHIGLSSRISFFFFHFSPAILRALRPIAGLIIKKLSCAKRVRQKHANFSFTIINSWSARSSHSRAVCSPLERSARGAAERSSVMDRAVRAIFSCMYECYPTWTYIKANLCRFSIKRRRAWEKTQVQGSQDRRKT